jgi:tetratricopeptide (TPR) repeat protein
MAEMFANKPEVNFELSRYYQSFPKELDKAVIASDLALENDIQNVFYALNASNLHYRKFSLSGEKSDLYRAIEIAKQALDFPGAQETTGPRNIVNRVNRLSLYYVLATCYIEQLLDPTAQDLEFDREQLIQNAEDAVYQIEQIFGSGEDIQVVQWQGMFELARGEKESAVRKLYDAYGQLRTSGIEDPGFPPSYLKSAYATLSYTLANHFKESTEEGAVLRFLDSARRSGIGTTKPQAILDYIEQLIKLERFTYVITHLNYYDNNFGVNQRSKSLRIKTYILSRTANKLNQFEDAERELENTDLSDFEKKQLELLLLQSRISQLQMALANKNNRTRMQQVLGIEPTTADSETEGQLDVGYVVELNKYRENFSDLIEKYSQVYPGSLDESQLLFACRNYLSLNRVESAQALIDTYLAHSPDSLAVLFYKRYLSEPDPANISADRRLEIQKEMLLNMPDSPEHWLNLGGLYLRQNEQQKAYKEFNKVLVVENWINEEGLFQKPDSDKFERTQEQLQIAASQLFGLAVELQDWDMAGKIANIARVENLDRCEGQYFSARLEVTQKRFEEALGYIQRALEVNPIFSYGYMLRSTVNSELGNENAAIEDAREAVALNPRNPNHVKRLALVLAQRNLTLGETASNEQITEARVFLDSALALNPSDKQLLSFYAEYISSMEPSLWTRALPIRLSLYEDDSNLENALLLGRMAVKIALSEIDQASKEVLLDLAGKTLEHAYRINPQDRNVLDAYAQYYRIIGDDNKAWQLLEQSEDKGLLWSQYYRQGRYTEAAGVLQQLHTDNPTDSNSIVGLLMVSRQTGDIEGVKEFSEKLISVENSKDNYLLQIQTFLQVGLVKESDLKLQSFMERFPEEKQALLLQASLFMSQGRMRNALEVANRYLETNEENYLAWEIRGKINYLTTNYSQAISDFNRSKALFDSPQLSIYLSKAYMRIERNQEAVTELQVAINNPQTSDTARLLLEETYKKMNRKDTLSRFYDDTLKTLPDSVFWYIKAASFAQQQGNFSRASELYSKALELSVQSGQGSLVALDGYLNALISNGEYSKVIEIVPNYVNGSFASVAWYRRAEAKLKLNDTIAAVENSQKALDSADPTIIRSTGIVDKVYSLLGKEVLYQYCEEKLQQNSNREKANLIMFYLMLKDNEQYNKAIEYIDNCIQIAGQENTQSVIYLLEKSRVLILAYEKTSDKIYLNKAIEEHKSLMQKMPKNIGILNNLAFLLAESGEDLVEALEYARRAYETQPNNPSILDTYAFVLYKNGQYEQAAELAQSALQHFEYSQVTTPGQVFEHLGMIREKLGLEKEAIDAYQQALSIGGFSEESIERINSAINRISQTSL